MEKYGSDKPDLRYGFELITLIIFLKNSEFKVFREAVKLIGIVTGLACRQLRGLFRNQIDSLTDYVKNLGATGLVWLKVKGE